MSYASCGHLMCIRCLCVCGAVYLLCICCNVSVDVFPLVAGLLARGKYSEGPATGQLDTGFSCFSVSFF
jgi:hypothetical protein